MKQVIIAFVLLSIFSCGEDEPDRYEELNDRVNSLQIISDSLQAVVQSDYATCPALGDTSDALIRKICNIAQAATNEARVELKGQISAYANQLNVQLAEVNNDLASHRVSLDSIQATLVLIQSDITTLQGQMTSANAAILALQNLTASISGILAGNMITLDIGNENAAAGPLYESVLRRNDKKRFNGYVEAYSVAQSLPNAPLTAVNASPTVTVTLTAHGYLVGDIIVLGGMSDEARGFTSGDFVGDFVVQTAVANSFTITMRRNATSSGTLGGNVGTVQRVLGRGMSTLWKSDDPSDVAVRVSNLGSKRYNFIIRRIASDVSNDTAELCYSTVNNTAIFSTINAASEGGSGNIVCK